MNFTLGLSLFRNNNLNHLSECLNSIWFNQSLKPELIIFVYDGYIPKQLDDLVQNFIIKTGCNHTTIRNKRNRGLTISLNKMLSITKTKYFARMDVDDVCVKNRFQMQINCLESNKNIDILGGTAIDIDDNSNEIMVRKVPEDPDKIKKLLIKVNTVIHPTVMMKTESVLSLGGYDENYRTSQDWALWFRALSKGLTIFNMKEQLIYYRVDTNYNARKNLKYRLNEVKMKYQGFKELNLSKFNIVYVLLPLFIWLVPSRFFKTIKKIDPRQN
jgi:glycosyltransferase EpsE